MQAPQFNVNFIHEFINQKSKLRNLHTINLIHDTRRVHTSKK